MYFSNDGKLISSKIKCENVSILTNLLNLHQTALLSTHTEVNYFRNFFPAFETYVNSIRIPGIIFNCKTKELHASPFVTFEKSKCCELGDYLINVEYKKTGVTIGKKSIVYQFKRSKKNWKIDQTQLYFLKNWPTFNFGKKLNPSETITINPTRPEFGSYVLVNDIKYGPFVSNIFGSAYEIHNNKTGKIVTISSYNNFYYNSIISYFNLLIWEIGEPISEDIRLFIEKLYDYKKWDLEAKDEDEVKFRIIDITVDIKE